MNFHEKRITQVEADIHVLVNTCNSLSDRVTRLEEAVKLIQFDNDIEPEPSSVWKCPHCGKSEGTWFDRTLDENGNMTTRCNASGKDIDKPSSVSECKTGSKNECEHLWNGIIGGRRCIYCGIKELIEPKPTQNHFRDTTKLVATTPQEAPHTKECNDECIKNNHVTCTCFTPKPSVEKCDTICVKHNADGVPESVTLLNDPDTIQISRKSATNALQLQEDFGEYNIPKELEDELKLALSNINGKGE
jgi:hypothetical protein